MGYEDFHDVYQDPLVGRYTGKEMQHIFSDNFKFFTWRRCWTALAEAEMEMGLEQITPLMIMEMESNQKNIDYQRVAELEALFRHDVLAHATEYGEKCPSAEKIIHLGATSQYVGCNTDLIQMREGAKILRGKLVNVIDSMAQVAHKYKDLATLGFTHYQPAQPTTVGKRFTLYINDLLEDLKAIENLDFRARGTKGTTGTQASYLKLFGGDFHKVQALDNIVAQKLGFDSTMPVTGQTYSRKFDTKVAEALAGIAVSLTKFAHDMRLSSREKIVDEPFSLKQRGSSAMPHKRNPMRHERLCAISRKVFGLVPNFYNTAANQWFERTLDDSAIRRMDIPQLFLGTDAILTLAYNITNLAVDPQKGRPLTFYPARCTKLLNDELPFMATEMILMDLVKQGHSRNEIHAKIEEHAHAAGLAIKEEGSENDLFDRLASDEDFPFDKPTLEAYLENIDEFIGAASEQTQIYLDGIVKPILRERKQLLEEDLHTNLRV